MPPSFLERLECLTEAIINEPQTNQKTINLQNLQLVSKIDVTIVAIIIGAYWHQDLQEVRARILDLQSHSSADIQELILAMAIAYACRGELEARYFISQIFNDLSPIRALSRSPENQQKCLAQLQLAHKLVDEGASAITAHKSHKLNNGLSEMIASSLYYFLSTPHSWHLITERAKRHANKNNLLIAIQSGAIAAAYLGASNSVSHLAGLDREVWSKGELLGNRLWSKWSGVYDCGQ